MSRPHLSVSGVRALARLLQIYLHMIASASKTRRRRRPPRTALMVAASWLATAWASGQPIPQPGQHAIQPLAAITAAATDFVRAEMPPGEKDIVVTAGRLDPRLRFARCGGPLEASLLSGARLQAQASIAVACSQGANWTVYVPVTIASRLEVWALKSPQAQGARLGAEDVIAETRLVSGLALGYVTDGAQLSRSTLRHPLPAGAVLMSQDLLPDFMVRQGEQVTMVAAVGGIQVKAAGLALQDGRYGALIRVQNVSSSRVVQGIVEANRVVDVTP
jgi:flagella basal body P-ring formation protein FlgA